MSASVEARGVRKEYGDLVAVEDLTFGVERGQILGVLGPNGAGKTTAIRVLTTILAPTRGTFVVAGVPHTRPADIRRRIGVLPESAGYPERQTGEEYLRYHARLYGQSKESAREVAHALLARKMQAVNAGSIGVFVAVLPRNDEPQPPATGPTVHVSIARRKTLSSGGILPLAIGIPALLSALLVGVGVRRRRSG